MKDEKHAQLLGLLGGVIKMNMSMIQSLNMLMISVQAEIQLSSPSLTDELRDKLKAIQKETDEQMQNLYKDNYTFYSNVTEQIQNEVKPFVSQKKEGN